MLVAVYGSLRPGMYNYDRFQKLFPGDILPKESFKLKGFKMFNLGSYPGIIPSNEKDHITIDILEVSEQSYLKIRDMELNSGYYEDKINLPNGSNASIFIYSNSTKLKESVDSGDWVEFLNSKK